MSLNMTKAQVTDNSNKIKQIQSMLQAVDEAADLMDSIKSGERNLSEMVSEIKLNIKKLESLEDDVKKAEKVVANARAKARTDMGKLEAAQDKALEEQNTKLMERLTEHNKSVTSLEDRKKVLSATIKAKTNNVIALDKKASALLARINDFNAQMNTLISKAQGK